MITGLFSQPNYVAAKKLLDAAVLRHEAIASNLANVETPNYKRMDVAPSFQADLQEAIKGQNSTQLAAVRPHLEKDSTAISNTRDGNADHWGGVPVSLFCVLRAHQEHNDTDNRKQEAGIA